MVEHQRGWVMNTKTKVMVVDIVAEKIEDSYTDLMRLIRSMPVAKILEPALSSGRSAKDIVAHLAAWEWRCAFLLEQVDVSNAPLLAEPDIEALNQEVYEERKAWSWEEVEDDARSAHRALLKAIYALPAERIADPIVYDAIALETWHHYQKHLPELQAWHNSHQESFK
jgi:hypothetical protein